VRACHLGGERGLVDDADRDAGVARLNDQYAQGAISLAELERRSTVALALGIVMITLLVLLVRS
jgi:Domain of unknown function (DUF1707)